MKRLIIILCLFPLILTAQISEIECGTWTQQMRTDSINENFSTLFSNRPIDVTLHGVVGDGVTENSAAIQTLIDSSAPYGTPFFGGGGVDLYFPPGQYLLDTTLIIRNSCKFVGAGADNSTTFLLQDGANCDMMVFGFDDSADPYTLHLEGFRMYMDVAQQTLGHANIRVYNYSRHSHFNDVFCFGATDYNFVMEQVGGFQRARNTYFYGCAFEGNRDGGMSISHDYNLNILHTYVGFSYDLTQFTYGMNILMTGQNMKVQHCWFLNGITYNNIKLSGVCSFFDISNNTFNSDGALGLGSAHIYIESNPFNGIISNNTFRSTLDYDYNIRLNNTNDVIVTGNVFNGYNNAPVLPGTGSNFIYRNMDASIDGYSQTSGSGTILNTSSTLVITHNCYETPTSVIVTSDKDENVWITNITSTQFTLNRAGTSGDLIVYYQANID